MSRISIQFLRFSVVGLLAVALAYVLYRLLISADLGSGMAYAIAYGCALSLSFFLNRNWSFQHTGRYLSTSIRFLVIHITSYLWSILVQQLTLHMIPPQNHGYEIAFFSAIAISTAINFVGSKFFIYR